jgi:trimeric autotransporter adhesin
VTLPTRRDEQPRAPCLLVALAVIVSALWIVSPASAAEVGHRDFSYGSNTSAPTKDEPQSKLWFNDGSWWGSLYNGFTLKYHIYRLNWTSQTWIDTGTIIDSRDNSRADTLWDGTHLYVATAGTRDLAGDAARILRYSYNVTTKTYLLDPGFPVTITPTGVSAIVMDKDGTGRLWATYTKDSQVYVTHSTTDTASWATPFVLPVAGATGLLAQDISAIVAFDNKIGVMWSNQVDWAFYFAVHVDGDPAGTWQRTTAYQGTEFSDNHINLKSLESDPSGQVFASVKTSLNAPTAPLVVLLRMRADLTWTSHVFGTVADQHTRPIINIDAENRRLYMFATAPCCNGGSIYYKQTSLDDLSFAPGVGTPFLESDIDTTINYATTSKQELSSSTGMVVLASDDTTRVYRHNSMGLGSGDSRPPETTIVSGPSGSTHVTSATFDFSADESGATFQCRLDGGAYEGCTALKNYSGLSPGPHSFDVRAIDLVGNVDPTPAVANWTVDLTTTVTVPVAADSYVDENNPNANRGTVVNLASDGSPKNDGYLRFDVSGLSSGIARASVRIHLTNGSSNGPAMYGTSNAWTEAGLTWNNRPLATTGALDDHGAVGANTWVEYDVTPFVAGNGSYSFILGSSSSDAVTFNSREALRNTPELVIDLATGDSTPPDTSIVSGPTGTVPSTNAAFSFSSSEAGPTFECSLDSAPFTACSTPQSYSELSEDEHSFAVRATDQAGNTDPTPASTTWIVSSSGTLSIGPVADADVLADKPTQNRGLTSSLISDASPATQSFLRFDVDGLAGGIETASLRVFASNGSVNGPAAYPTVNSWSETGITWNNKPQASGPVIDDVDQVPLNTWVDYDVTSVVTGNGTYSFVLTTPSNDAVELKSREGPVNDPELVITTSGEDEVPPETSIDSGPSGPVTTDLASFTFSSLEEGSTFNCRLDSGLWGPCTSPKTYTELDDGHHVFEVAAIDPAGNVDPTPASRDWVKDTVAPSVSQETPSAGATNAGAAVDVVAVFSEPMLPSSIGSGTFTLTQRGSPTPVPAAITYSPGTATATLDPDADLSPDTIYDALITGGSAGLRDVAGNAMASDHAWSFQTASLDVTAPETTIDSGPMGTTDETTATLTFSSSEPGSTFECSLDAAAYDICTSGRTYTGITNGQHTFSVRAIDAAGNVDPTPATNVWTVEAPFFQDAFGSGSFDAWTTVSTGADGSTSVQSGAARLSATTAIGSFAYARAILGAAQTAVTVEGRFRVTSEGASGGNVPLFRLFDGVGTRLVSIHRQNADASRIYANHSGTNFATTGTVPLDVWTEVWVRVVTAGPGAGTVQVRIDDNLVYSTSSASVGSSGVMTIQIGNETKRQAFTLFTDDILVGP